MVLELEMLFRIFLQVVKEVYVEVWKVVFLYEVDCNLDGVHDEDEEWMSLYLHCIGGWKTRDTTLTRLTRLTRLHSLSHADNDKIPRSALGHF